MQQQNNFYRQPFLIVFFTFIALLIVSLVLPASFWKKNKLTQVSVFSDLEVKKERKKVSTYKPKKKQVKLRQIVKDTIEANIAVTQLIREDVAIEVNDTSVSHAGLERFLTALNELSKQRRKKVRVGYFGDSMIEGDLITQTIRNILQNKFGGDGVGFVPVTSIVAHFRQTVKVKANEHWEDVNYTANKKKQIIGLSGHTFFAKEGARVDLKPGGGRHLNSLYELSLLCGASENAFEFDLNDHTQKVALPGMFNVVKLNGDSNVARASLGFRENNVPVYGFASESRSGVILDNLSFRGTSGTELVRLNSKMLKQIDSLRHYDLIVLHYGPNLLYSDSITNFAWYQRQLEKSLKHLKAAFPNTSFLIISTADKAFKIDGEYRTGDGVEQLLKAQQNAAKKYNCAFYNLYEAMGGYNSMKTWAEKHPILAGNDYTHFNQSGSAKIGRLIGNAILNEYEQNYPAK